MSAVEDLFGDAPAANDELFKEPKVIEGRSSRIMPHPITGVPAKFQRASEFAQTTADRHMVEEWKIGMSIMGLANNRGLYAQAASMVIPKNNMEDRPKGWWIPWADIGHEAMDAADSQNGSRLGKAVHNFIEAIETGRMTLKRVPDDWRPHVERIIQLHKAWGMITEPQYLERLIVNLAASPPKSTRKGTYQGICGRFDALRRMPDGTLMIDDTKTGKNAPEGLDEIAVQLACYANAEWIWDEKTETYFPMPPEVRKDIATITWVPIDDPSRGEIIPVDLSVGWEEGVELARRVREYRARAKRKNNGIRHPEGALEATAATEEYDPGASCNWAERVEACSTLTQLSAVFTEASGLGKWSHDLTSQAEEVEGRIRETLRVNAIARAED